MKLFLKGAALALLMSGSASAQVVTLPQVNNVTGQKVGTQGVVLVDAVGDDLTDGGNNAVRMNCVAGCTGGGGGSSSGGTATSVAPTYVNGATSQPLSLDLAGNLRTIGAVSVTGTVPVSGIFWQATQPVSAAALPLPNGASTSAGQGTTNTALTAIQTAVTGPTPAGTNLIGQVQPSYLAPGAWANPATAQDMRAYSSVTVAVTTAPSAAYIPQWSPDGTNWFAITGLDLGLGTQTNIGTTFTGAITFKGGGYLRLNGGTGGAFQILAGQ